MKTISEISAAAVTVTDQSFATEVLNSTEPVLVDFWAPWCGPCRMLGPALEELAREFAGRVRVAKLNVDESPETAARFRIHGLPTILIFKNGQVIDRIIGLVPKKLLSARLLAQAA
jgi:thioredoxin 1